MMGAVLDRYPHAPGGGAAPDHAAQAPNPKLVIIHAAALTLIRKAALRGAAETADADRAAAALMECLQIMVMEFA